VSRLLGLRDLLEAGGRPWPAPLEHHAEIGSTSERLKELARAGAPELSVVTADTQTAGRGRQGHAWASPRGNLHLSVLLRPAATPGLLPLLGGVAVREALVSFGAAARLKWPNDVLVDDRKLAGLLAEGASGPQGIEWVVLGIGVNVDPETAGPGADALPESATTLRAAAGRAVVLETVAAEVLWQVALWYHRAAAGRMADVLAAWREAAVCWWGRPVLARAGEQVIRGIAKDIDEEGALLLTSADGGVVRVVAGEVTRVRLTEDGRSE
jgi:BirA family biotin operon repressor/biotin-[acetyl-CoA-carboxylase] ligase